METLVFSIIQKGGGYSRESKYNKLLTYALAFRNGMIPVDWIIL